MHFDEILRLHLGEFGRYQKRVYLAVCLMILTVACHQLAQVFLLAQVDHWCRVSELDNDNCSSWETTMAAMKTEEDCERNKMAVYRKNEVIIA